VAFTTLVRAAPRIGAYAGPLGIALGLTTGWAVVLLRRRRTKPA
jgi:hypothetical protein